MRVLNILSDLAQERLCKAFFPNCNICNCFKNCFPDSKKNDISSKPFFEHEALMNRLDKFSKLEDVQKIEIVEAFTDLLEDQGLKLLTDP